MNRPAPRLVLPLLGLLALCACASAPAKEAAVEPRTPTEQFPLKAASAPDELRLAPHPGGLSDAQRAALADLAARWQAAGGGVVLVREPLKGGDARAIYASGMGSVAALIADGVPARQVRRVGYDPDGDGPAPVIVGFEAYAAVVPACGRHWDNLTATGSNKPYENFGCAISANMAAEIANPADIAAQHPIDPPDAQRFSNTIEQYRAGPSSSSGSSSGASGGGSSSGSGGGSSSGSGSGAGGASSTSG